MVRTIKCKRCGRALKTKESRARGYGPVCWEKEGRFQAVVTPLRGHQQAEIAQLRKEVAALKALVHSLQVAPPRHEVIPMPNGGAARKIPVMVGGWDVSELQANPLFRKMQAQVEAC